MRVRSCEEDERQLVLVTPGEAWKEQLRAEER